MNQREFMEKCFDGTGLLLTEKQKELLEAKEAELYGRNQAEIRLRLSHVVHNYSFHTHEVIEKMVDALSVPAELFEEKRSNYYVP